MKIDAEKSVGALEHALRAANALPREMHCDQRRLCGESGLQALHQRRISRDLVIASDRTVDDAERI